MMAIVGECWMWPGSTNPDGYAMCKVNGRTWAAHKAIFETLRHDVPKGMQLDHLCRNRACVNPFHLDVVTQQENILRGEGLAAKNFRKGFCDNGHPFDYEYITRKGKTRRVCKTCRDERVKKFWERRHATA